MGANIHERIEGGGTLLMIAVYYGQKEVAGWLLSQGLEINQGNDQGTTPLAIAVMYGHQEMADLLKKHRYATAKEPTNE